MKRTLIALISMILINPLSAKDNVSTLGFPAEVVAVQSYSHIWIYPESDSMDEISKYVEDDKPQRLPDGFVLIAFSGIEHQGPNEEILLDENNQKYIAFTELTKSIEGKVFNITCSEVINNIPACIVHINDTHSINEYLLMKGFAKMNNENWNKKGIEERLSKAEAFAQANKLGVWEPFYGIFEQF